MNDFSVAGYADLTRVMSATLNIEAVDDNDPERRKDTNLNISEDSGVINIAQLEVIDVVENDKETRKPDPEAIVKLSDGLLHEYMDDLKRVQTNLSDLTKNQNLLIDTVQQENSRFSEMQEIYNMEDMFQRAKLYHTKLVKIKRDMAELYQRSNKLKKRSLKLQHQKQKEALQIEQQREREFEREKHLLAKVAVRSPQS